MKKLNCALVNEIEKVRKDYFSLKQKIYKMKKDNWKQWKLNVSSLIKPSLVEGKGSWEEQKTIDDAKIIIKMLIHYYWTEK